MSVASPSIEPAPSLLDHKVRVLFIAVNPGDTARLAIGEEHRKIREALLAVSAYDRFDMIVEHELRAEEFSATLRRHRPDVVHFSGHGVEDGSLLLPDANGTR